MKNIKIFLYTLVIANIVGFFALSSSDQAYARDQIKIVGSSTVFPFSSAVAERFGKTKYKTPIVESTGTGGGFKIFCSGRGLNTPDISNASRRIKKSEYTKCLDNGVTVTEVQIGYDGISVAYSNKNGDLNLTREHLYKALAKEVVIDGKLTANPYKKWSDIDSSLPNIAIKVMGPPPTSGTRDAFLELAMEAGAKTDPVLSALKKSDSKAFKKASHTLREDGAYIEAGENDNLIVQKLKASPDLIGIFGFSFLEENADSIKAIKIEGVLPTFDNIIDGKYTISRSLFFYVKREHVKVVPGLKEFVETFVDENTMGINGYLVDKSLIPLQPDQANKYRADVASMKQLEM